MALLFKSCLFNDLFPVGRGGGNDTLLPRKTYFFPASPAKATAVS